MIFILNNIKSRSLLEKITAGINDTLQIIPVYIDVNNPIKQLFDLSQKQYSEFFLSGIIGDKVIKGISIPTNHKTALERLLNMRFKISVDYIPLLKFLLGKIYTKNLLLCSMQNRFGKYGSDTNSLYIIDELNKEEFGLLDKQIFNNNPHNKFIISTEETCELGKADIVISESDTLDVIKKKLETFNQFKMEIDLNTQEGFDTLFSLIDEKKETSQESNKAAEEKVESAYEELSEGTHTITSATFREAYMRHMDHTLSITAA